MNRSHQQIFGLAENKDVENIQYNVIYGFAYYIPDSGWVSFIGTFSYLWGIYSGLGIVKDATEEEPASGAYTFLYVDEQYNPIKLIGAVSLDHITLVSIGQGFATHPPILMDLSSLGWGDVPRMNFEF